MPVRIVSAGGGGVTLSAASTGSEFTATLPANTGTVVTTASSAAVTPAMLTQPLTRMTAQASTSGTAIDFTGIPSWVRRLTVMFDGVSTNGTSIHLIQLGTSAGIVSTGYSGTSGNRGGEATSTAGFQPWWSGGPSAAWLWSGSMIITNVTGNVWNQITSMNAPAGPTIGFGSGVVSLAGTLDRVRITTVNGTDLFDAGSINILYEG